MISYAIKINCEVKSNIKEILSFLKDLVDNTKTLSYSSESHSPSIPVTYVIHAVFIVNILNNNNSMKIYN